MSTEGAAQNHARDAMDIFGPYSSIHPLMRVPRFQRSFSFQLLSRPYGRAYLMSALRPQRIFNIGH
jgi:hypothetical protein